MGFKPMGLCEGCTGMGCQATCQGGCKGGCRGGCTGCGGDCSGSCRGYCGTACSTNCTGCTSCTGCTGCTSCSGTCRGGCRGCSGCTSCSGTCRGGCTGCTGSCKGYCDNACTASNAADVINSLGANIKAGNFIRNEDFIAIKNAINNELTRRGRASRITNWSPTTPADGVIVVKNHADVIFGDAYDIENSHSNSRPSSGLVVGSNLQTTIAYIKTKMNQNIRK